MLLPREAADRCLAVLRACLQRGLLVDDTIVIRYQIELVVAENEEQPLHTSKPVGFPFSWHK